MAKTGRPRRNSIEAFAAAIDACIAAYEESDDAHDLTDYALAQRLKLSIDQLDAYYEGEPDRAIASRRYSAFSSSRVLQAVKYFMVVSPFGFGLLPRSSWLHDSILCMIRQYGILHKICGFVLCVLHLAQDSCIM